MNLEILKHKNVIVIVSNYLLLKMIKLMIIVFIAIYMMVKRQIVEQ